MNTGASKNRLIQIGGIALALLLGVLGGIYILGTGKAPHGHEQGAAAGPGHDDALGAAHAEEGELRRGPHGGRLFGENGYDLEVTIFEAGVEPQFRVYTYQNGKLLNPAESLVTITLDRLGRKAQIFNFSNENDYLKGDGVVEEPHSFNVTIAAKNAGKTYSFAYEQVEARATISDVQMRQNGIEVAAAGPARIRTTLELIGEIRLNEDRTVHIVPRLTGVAQSVSANAGDAVRKGQILAVLSSQALADQRSELLAAQKRLKLAQTTLEREKELWEARISAEQDFLQASTAFEEVRIVEESARQKLASLGAAPTGSGDLTRYEVRSPIDGVITEKNVAVGEVLSAETPIFVVADLSTVWVEVIVYPQDLNAIATGQKATVRAAPFDLKATGQISYLGSILGDQTRTAKARLVIANPKGMWRPGLPVTVQVVAGEVEVPVAVAAEGIQTFRDWTVVFGRYGEHFEARPIEVGRSDGEMVEVVSGIEPNERYAVRNSFLIKADIGKAGATHDH